MTLTFAIKVIYWSRPTYHLSSSVLASSTANYNLFSTKGHGDLDHDLQCHLLVRTNIPPISKHCQVIKLFSTKGPDDLDLCPKDHLLVRTNISTNFEGPNHKHYRIISIFGIKGHGDLDL